MPQFDNRNPNVGIFKISNIGSDMRLADFGVANARDVILHCNGISVLLKEIRAIGTGSFIGIVFGFEPADQEVHGLSEGDEVSFEECHIISMGK